MMTTCPLWSIIKTRLSSVNSSSVHGRSPGLIYSRSLRKGPCSKYPYFLFLPSSVSKPFELFTRPLIPTTQHSDFLQIFIVGQSISSIVLCILRSAVVHRRSLIKG